MGDKRLQCVGPDCRGGNGTLVRRAAVGGSVVQETRLFDPDKGVTRTLRTKEDAHDYRYFPDPDLLPL
ncbi:MAG: hypothetical protein ACJ8D3_00185, partial [Sphingomicrobium sp.]